MRRPVDVCRWPTRSTDSNCCALSPPTSLRRPDVGAHPVLLATESWLIRDWRHAWSERSPTTSWSTIGASIWALKASMSKTDQVLHPSLVFRQRVDDLAQFPGLSSGRSGDLIGMDTKPQWRGGGPLHRNLLLHP
jgi:hypothetical protein